MTQIFTGTGLGTHGSSLGQLGKYGPKGSASLGSGGDSVYVNGANGNLVLKQTDGFLSDLGIGMDVFQTYNSRGEGTNPWCFNLETRLMFEGIPNTAGSIVKRLDEDGHLSCFTYDTLQKAYIAEDGSIAKITYNKGDWQYLEGIGQARYNYNSKGQLTSLSDKDGHVLSLNYENGHLSRITDIRDKQSITWSFNQGVLSDVTFVSDGKTTHHLHYEYDSQNRLTKVSRDLGEGKIYWISYRYVGDSNLITDINQSDGTKLHIDYDKEGRVKHLIDGEGRISNYKYLSGKTIVTNGLGESWTYFYDTDARLTGIDGPENYHARYYYEGKHLVRVTQGKQRWNFTYNEAGDCTRIQGPSGEVIQRTYDKEHRILTETRYQSFDGEHHPSKPRTARYVYDENGHLRFEIKADGTVTEYRYDQEGLRLSSRCYLHAQFDTKFYEDNQSPSLDEMTQWSQQQNPQAINLTSFSYDWRGNLCEEIHYTVIDEQGNGFQTKDTLKSYSRYDAAGRLIEKSSITEKGLAATYYFYDGLGRLIRTIDNQQHSTIIEYDDEHHRIIKTDANGLQTITTYDQSGLLLCTQKLDKTHDFGSTFYRYDTASRLISETDVSGKTHYFFYDEQGRLIARVMASGQVSEYQYDDEGHCIKTHLYQKHIDTRGFQDHLPDWNKIKPETSSQDRISQVVYNDLNQIAYQINTEGAVIAYQYDAEGRIIAKTAYANRLSQFVPTKLLTYGDVVIQTNSKDRTISYYYDMEGRLVGEINGEGAATNYRYDALGNLIETHHYSNYAKFPLSGDWQFDIPSPNQKDIRTFSLYNAAGLKIADIDAEGYLIEYRFDARGLLTAKVAYYTKRTPPVIPDASTTLEALRPLDHSNDHHTFYIYNDLGQLIEEQTQSGLVTSYTYNETGQIISKTNTDKKTHEARKQQYRYDALGRVIQSLDPLGSLRLEQSGDLNQDEINTIWQQHSTRYQYDKAGLLLSKTNALNQTTHYYYNEAGLLAFTLSSEGSITETRYNDFSQVETTIRYYALWKGKRDINTEQLQSHINALADQRFDEVTHYNYNSLGLVTSKSYGSGSKIKTIYNAFGEIEQTSQSIRLNRETIKAYEYDCRGLLRMLTNDLGGINKTFETQYDTFGRMVRTINARQKEKTYLLNKRGEILLIANPDQGKKLMRYDAFGRVLTLEDKNKVSYFYDDQNNTLTLKRAVDDDTSSVVTEFNAFGDKITFIDGNQHKTIFQYDTKGQLIHVDGPEHSTSDYQYDAEGQLIIEQKGKNYKIGYTYNADGRILTKSIDPENLNIKTIFTYDGIGRQLSINEAGRLTQFTYDNQGNLIKKCLDPNGLNLITEFSYTQTGLLSRQTIFNTRGNNKVTAYEWDALGRCISTTVDPDGLALTTQYDYDNNDNLICQTDAKKQCTQYLYDANNQLRYQIDPRGVVIEHRYDLKGNEIKSITYANRIAPLKYDEAHLIQALQPSNNDHYKFYAYDNQSRVFMSYDGLGYATEYIYDANDNIIAKKQHAIPCSLNELKNGNCPVPLQSIQTRITYFAYDGLNQERYQIDPSGHVTEYCYDSAGQVIQQTRFALSLNLNEMDGKLSISSIQDALKTDETLDQTTYYTYDAVGRLHAQANPSGAVTSYQYDDAGNLIATTRYANPLNITAFNKESWSTHVQLSKNDRTTHAVFDAAGREVYRVSSTGKVVAREYDEVGNVLTERIYAQTLMLSNYTLNEINDALKSTKSQDQLTTYEYDVTGRLLSKTDALKHSTKYTYDENNNVISKTDANNMCWTYRYDECNQLIETSTPKTKVSRYSNGKPIEEMRSIKTLNSYDSFGNLITTIRDADGMKQTIHYTYDGNNQKIATIYPDVMINKAGRNASAERQEEMKTLSETLSYNAFGEVINSTDKAGHTRHWAYDLSGNMRYSIDAKNGLTQYQYDAFDNVQKKTSYATQINLSADSDYSVESIKKAQHINEHDRSESYWYDKEGRLIETRKDSIISYNSRTGKYQNLNPTKRITYNAFGEVIKTEVQLSDAQWAVTSFYYDLEGLKTAQIDAEGYLTRYTYNDFCLVESEIQFAARCNEWTLEEYKAPESNLKDRTVTFSYDVVGQLISKTLKAVSYQKLNGNNSQYKNITGDLTSSYSYDALGNLVSTTDALGHTVYSYYNEVGQLTAKVGATIQAGRSATTYSYDALGQLVETHQWANGAKNADENNFILEGASTKDIITSDVYDLHGNHIQQTDGTGHQINYSFDANGNVTRSWQVLQRTGKSALIQDKRFTFDAENHLIQTATIKANGSYATDDAQYNAFGEVVAKGLNSKYTTHIDYDKIGRVWRSNLQGYYQIYVYDLTDHVTQIVTSTNAFGIENDEKGVDLSNSYFEKAINYNEQKWLYDLQRQDNVYDSLGRLLSQSKDGSTNITDKKNKKVNKKANQVNELDRWGNAISHTNANGHTTHYEYNAFDQVTKQTLPQVKVVDEHGISQMISPELNFAYDALGRVIAMTDANKHTVAKVLDADGRIIQEIDALGQHRDKSYDLLGQLTSTTTKRNNSIIRINYTYDKANRLKSVGTPKSMQYYVYDEAGQLIKQIDGLGNASSYEYDELGHQVEREQQGHKTITNFDDAGHKLNEKDAKGNTQSWVYNENGKLKEHTDLGGHKTVYTYNTNGLILTEKNLNGKKDKAYHYFNDGQLEQYEDKSRNEIVNFTYDDEGNVLSKESSAINAWIVETDYYAYDALGRLIQVRRRNPNDKDKRNPDVDKSLLSIDYEYDAVGNIRDTKVMARNANHQAVTQNNYYLYDENNRVILSKGQLQNDTIAMTKTQGSEITYDETGTISSAKKYEGGAVHNYTYHYNSDNLLDAIKKDGHNLQTKVYDDAGNVTLEYCYNNDGNITQKNIMNYVKGLLQSIKTIDSKDKEISLTEYKYDNVDNLETLTTVVRAQGNSAEYKEIHKYTYELWDSYQQKYDSATRIISGQSTQTGLSERKYDANGQLEAAIDSSADPKGQNNTTKYLNSSLDGIRARIDKMGQTSYLTVAGKTIGDLRLDNNGVTHLEVYGGFTPTGTPEQGKGMMPSMWQKGNKTLTDSFQNTTGEVIPPEAPQDSLGIYSLQSGDTLESIALQVYGDASLWYLIADANGITNRCDRAGEQGSQMQIGQRLNIPPVASSQHHTNSTHKVLNSSDVIGNTSATIPLPPAPPAPKRHNSPWRILGKIAVAVIATVATVLSAGAIGVALGAAGSAGSLGGLLGLGTTVLGGGGGALLAGSTTLGSIGVGFAAGFIGSIAGQGAAAVFGLQKGIDLKGALITGLATAATAGVSNALSNNVKYQNLMNAMDNHSSNAFSIKSASEMMERDVLSQGINLSTRKHQHLDWLELSISTATAGFMGSDTGKSLNQNLEKTFKKTTPTISSELQSLVSEAATAAATGTHFNAAQVLTDNLGSAIGNNVVQANALIGSEEAAESAVEAAKHALEEEEKKVTLAELMQSKVDTRAEQSRGAWNDEISDDLVFNSDLFKPWGSDGEEVLFNFGRFNGVKNLELHEIINDLSISSKIEIDLTEKVSNFDQLQCQIFEHEGGISNHKNDSGGFTNKGITLETFKRYAKEDLGIIPTAQNLKKLTNVQASIIYKKRFWDPIKADEINSLSIAYALFDFHVNAPGQAVKILQKSVNSLGGNLVIDNKMGPKSIKAINSVDAHKLFNIYKKNKILFYTKVADSRASQKEFLKGWINRVNSIKFKG